ncbi:FtsX-like permease family protein [uncultured archaeon]|nr:FtsX-like permease family protein [uncultured archaeon]
MVRMDKERAPAPRVGDQRAVGFLAFKDVVKDKKMAVLVVTILAVSYVNLIFFSSFMNGLTNMMEDQLIDLMTSHITLEPKENQKYISGVSGIENKLELMPGLVAIAPRLNSQGSVSYKTKTVGAPINGITPSKEAKVTILAEKVVSGEFLSDGDTDQALVGLGLTESTENDMGVGAANLGSVSVGDRVTIAYSNGVVKSYRVKGLIKTNFGLSDMTVFVTNKEMESVYSMKDHASSILVRIKDKGQTEQYKNLIMAENVGATVKTWKESARFIQSISGSLDMVSAITAFVGLLVSAMTMAVIIFINTTHKRRQIGILKAIGAKDSVILRIYLIESAIFGIFGIAAGVVIGYGIMYMFNMYPINLSMGLIYPYLKPAQAVTAAILLLVSVVAAGFYPAWKAANENILKAIQGE